MGAVLRRFATEKDSSSDKHIAQRRPIRRRGKSPARLSSAKDSDYTIFFSHRHQDESVTKRIIDILHRHTDRVQCFISEEIEKGTDWRTRIAEVLSVSSFLVLVFTDPQDEWGWCLYETGFFDALSQIPGATHARRIYCLHSPSNHPPSPLANLQSISATAEDISRWLKDLFNLTKQTKVEFRQDIPTISAQISDLFRVSAKPLYLARHVDITINCSSLTSPDDLPHDTIIQGHEGLMEEVFGTNTGRINWKSAKDSFSQFPNSSDVNFRTLKEISRAVYSLCKNNRVVPIQGTIFVGQGPKRYRPVISDAREVATGQITCHVLLVEEVGGPLQNVDKALGALLTAIRMAVRIRWEIVRPFSSNLRFLSSREPGKLRFDLQTCLNYIFSEAEFRGTYSLVDLLSSFDDDDDKVRMQKIMDDAGSTFEKIWNGIGFTDTAETFGEVSTERFSEDGLALLDTGLVELKKRNREFLEMGVVRAEALIRRELERDNS